MEYQLNTRLNGNVAMSHTFHDNPALMRDRSLYKFIWVQKGSLSVEVDHIPVCLEQNDIISLTPLHHIGMKSIGGEYLTFLFNSNFYCIFGHDDEVSCNGFLFNGSSNLMILHLTAAESAHLHSIADIFRGECTVEDDLQEEMLRIVLKRFIITCTRIARERFSVTREKEKSFDLVRQFYVLVDIHFREKKKVSEYADLLHRSPKTLTNLFAGYDLPTPLQVIHERITAEARRLLLYTNKSAKEIAGMLGFEDLAAFSRFFKKCGGESITAYRTREKREELPTHPDI